MTDHGLHEPAEALDGRLVDRHRAIVSLMEELEAVDWYDQRIAVVQDDDLRRILVHNRDEEKEHGAMLLGWLEANDDGWREALGRYVKLDPRPSSGRPPDL